VVVVSRRLVVGHLAVVLPFAIISLIFVMVRLWTNAKVVGKLHLDNCKSYFSSRYDQTLTCCRSVSSSLRSSYGVFWLGS
jgi:hypothetical protein